MGLKNIKPQVGLLIVAPIVVGMLVFGVYNWPSGKSSAELMQRAKEVKDSIKAVETIQEVR